MFAPGSHLGVSSVGGELGTVDAALGIRGEERRDDGYLLALGEQAEGDGAFGFLEYLGRNQLQQPSGACAARGYDVDAEAVCARSEGPSAGEVAYGGLRPACKVETVLTGWPADMGQGAEGCRCRSVLIGGV